MRHICITQSHLQAITGLEVSCIGTAAQVYDSPGTLPRDRQLPDHRFLLLMLKLMLMLFALFRLSAVQGDRASRGLASFRTRS